MFSKASINPMPPNTAPASLLTLTFLTTIWQPLRHPLSLVDPQTLTITLHGSHVLLPQGSVFP